MRARASPSPRPRAARGACTPNWEADGSKQWETFLSSELPDWLAANKGLAPGGHGIVGAAQGGTGAMTLAAFHPDRFRYAGSLSGFLTPSATSMNGAITAGLAQFGGVNTASHVGCCHSSAGGSGTTPTCTSRFWPTTTPGCGCTARPRWTCSDPAAMIGYCDQAQGSNRTFYQHYRGVGGHNGHFDFPTGGQHDWGSWGPQLGAMSGDLAAAIR